jgi:hypothetical protein
MFSNISINITGYINNKIDLGLRKVTKRWTNNQELKKHDMKPMMTTKFNAKKKKVNYECAFQDEWMKRSEYKWLKKVD